MANAKMVGHMSASQIRPNSNVGPAQSQVVREDLGRSILRIYLHAREFPASPSTSYAGAALKAGRLMDFGARIRRQASDLTGEQILAYARLVGLDHSDLVLWALPAMQRAEVLLYQLDGANVTKLEEYIGVQAPFLAQVAAVWDELGPTGEERCALESVRLGAYAPLTLTDHQSALSAAGFAEEVQANVLSALDAMRLLQRARSQALNEDIVFNEYVWGGSAVPIAEFLHSLPTNERSVLTRLSAQALDHPGSSTDQFGISDAKLIDAARQVGFLDPISVRSTSQQQARAFIFHPALERQLTLKQATDTLHERKLFVAHILFGHRYGFPGTGKIASPVVLVQALLNRKVVGPATAIASDYPLIESHGIARVEPSSHHRGRAYLRLIKEDVVRDSLDLLKAALGESGELGSEKEPLGTLWVPGTYAVPERLRVQGQLRPGAEKEVFDAAIMELRKQAGRKIRLEELY